MFVEKLDKLKGIKVDLVRGNEGWQSWNFKDLLEQLKRWRDINPAEDNSDNNNIHEGTYAPRMCALNTQQCNQDVRVCACIYCDDESHKGAACTKVQTSDERRKILSQKKLCFNCTGAKHRASDCRSKANCQKCSKRHHTSICEQDNDN